MEDVTFWDMKTVVTLARRNVRPWITIPVGLFLSITNCVDPPSKTHPNDDSPVCPHLNCKLFDGITMGSPTSKRVKGHSTYVELTLVSFSRFRMSFLSVRKSEYPIVRLSDVHRETVAKTASTMANTLTMKGNENPRNPLCFGRLLFLLLLVSRSTVMRSCKARRNRRRLSFLSSG